MLATSQAAKWGQFLMVAKQRFDAAACDCLCRDTRVGWKWTSSSTRRMWHM
jgi:hypothetical protein